MQVEVLVATGKLIRIRDEEYYSSLLRRRTFFAPTGLREGVPYPFGYRPAFFGPIVFWSFDARGIGSFRQTKSCSI
jgi:hypothetical protein